MPLIKEIKDKESTSRYKSGNENQRLLTASARNAKENEFFEQKKKREAERKAAQERVKKAQGAIASRNSGAGAGSSVNSGKGNSPVTRAAMNAPSGSNGVSRADKGGHNRASDSSGTNHPPDNSRDNGDSGFSAMVAGITGDNERKTGRSGHIRTEDNTGSHQGVGSSSASSSSRVFGSPAEKSSSGDDSSGGIAHYLFSPYRGTDNLSGAIVKNNSTSIGLGLGTHQGLLTTDERNDVETKYYTGVVSGNTDKQLNYHGRTHGISGSNNRHQPDNGNNFRVTPSGMLLSNDFSNSEQDIVGIERFPNKLEQSVINYNNKLWSALDINSNYNMETGSFVPTIAKYNNSEGYRFSGAYDKVIDQFDVENNDRYTPGNKTYCNIYAWDVTSAMGAELPHWVNNETNGPYEYNSDLSYNQNAEIAREMTVNRLIPYMEENAELIGYWEVTPEEAQKRANSGYPTIALRTGSEHGHIVVIRPNYDLFSNDIAISQAGRINFNNGELTDISSYTFYTHY